MMTHETFLGLTATEIQGLAAIASVALTFVLVWTTIRYMKLTSAIATPTRASHEHELDLARKEAEQERAIVVIAVASLLANLDGMGKCNLVNEAVTKTLPDRVPGPRVPSEILIGYARGISAEVCFKLACALFDLDAADSRLRAMKQGNLSHAQLAEIAEAAQGCFKAALKNSEECHALLTKEKA